MFRQPIVKSLLMSFGMIVLVICVEYFLMLAYMPLSTVIDIYTYSAQLLIRVFSTGMLLLIFFLVRRTTIPLPAELKKQRLNVWVLYMLFLFLFTMPNIINLESNP